MSCQVRAEAATSRAAATNIELRRKKERRFFMLSALNALALEAMLFSFHVLAYKVSGRWGLFATTTIGWAANHAVNALLFLVFNSELRTSIAQVLCFS